MCVCDPKKWCKAKGMHIARTFKNDFCTHTFNLRSNVPSLSFSSNLFHGHIVQTYIDQMSPPENKKKVALEKFLE